MNVQWAVSRMCQSDSDQHCLRASVPASTRQHQRKVRTVLRYSLAALV